MGSFWVLFRYAPRPWAAEYCLSAWWTYKPFKGAQSRSGVTTYQLVEKRVVDDADDRLPADGESDRGAAERIPVDLVISSCVPSKSVKGGTGETDKVGGTVNRARRSVFENVVAHFGMPSRGHMSTPMAY